MNSEPGLVESLYRAASAAALADEQEAVSRLAESIAHIREDEALIAERAGQRVAAMREQSDRLAPFLREFGIETPEGVALMCLAEALLRIPDAATAEALIRDKLDHAAWDAHLSLGGGFAVNASAFALMLGGKAMHIGDKPGNLLKGLIRRLSEPVVREAMKRAMRFLGHQFVLGETIEEALVRAREFEEQGYRFSYDVLGEGARTLSQAEAYVGAYYEAIRAVTPSAEGHSLASAPSISIKLSGLHPRYQLTQQARVMEELMPRLKGIVRKARGAGMMVALDAEEASRLDLSMLIFAGLAQDHDFAGWNGLGFVVQAYQKRAPLVVDWLEALARDTGRVIPVRLVKGAYWDGEIKAAQAAGLAGYPVYTRKEHTDISYLACADKLLAAHDCFFPQFATHNVRTVESVLALAARRGVAAGMYEFQRLHGMGEALHDQLVAEGIPCRIYAPIGPHKDLLPYLIRRLLENGANTSFVHRLMDEDVPVAELLADPLAAEQHGFSPHPSIPLPEHIYGARRNSRGVNFGTAVELEGLAQAMAAEVDEVLGHYPAADMPIGHVQHVIGVAVNTAQRWKEVPVAERAHKLMAAADIIEASQNEIIAMLALEGGKTLSDGVAEVREAADFCRYYAAEAVRLMSEPQTLPGPTGERNQLSLHPRGVFACIAPWNFPLAIFIGQAAAALASGNAVLAKPAEQTPRIATLAVRLLHRAGIPHDALQLVIGPGETTGAALIDDPRVAGVAFTGSVETARHIQQALAERRGPIATLIAETGGQNCMVVDSSALLEQAVDDIVLSAFGSAGQRCSALRVLFVQEDVADALLELLAGAMMELQLGDPLDPATDIGPVIDEAAASALYGHIERMRQEARLIASVPLPEYLPAGRFVPPYAFEINDIHQLPGEVFGPVLHVIRFPADAMAQVAEMVGSTGYGLTFGIHSRIDAHVRFFTEHVRAGNIYVNRSMIGAVVGVQPFGGEGLSGTGPKAGGPYTLLRFTTERTLSANTAAIGGNIALLA